MASTQTRVHQQFALYYGNTHDDIIIEGGNGEKRYFIDPEHKLSFVTREYLAKLALLALMTGSTFANLYKDPSLDQVKAAVKVMADGLDVAELQRTLESIWSSDGFIVSQAGTFDLSGWDPDDGWIVCSS